MESAAWIHTLELRHPFGLSRGSVRALPTVLVRLDGGVGEGAPVRYLDQSAPAERAALVDLIAAMPIALLDDPTARAAWSRGRAPTHSAARAALDIACWDRAARRRGEPLHRHLGAPAPAGVTSYTIALDDPAAMEARAREAAHLPILKVKLGKGPDHDRAVLRRIAAAAPSARLRVDANGGWSFDPARALIPEFVDLGVDLIEQPLPRGAHDDLARLRGLAPASLIADEDVQGLASLAALRGRVDGINIKLMKCGGIAEALAMIDFARAEGWRILLGCMIETRVGLGAAAHLAGLVDDLDLDAHMLTTNDPTGPGSLSRPAADLPLTEGPGIGVEPVAVD